ncbi:MAG: serine hydrolase domain-containing protein [Anaerolineales bacterium]
MNQAAPEEYGFSPDRLDRIDSHMQDYVNNHRLAGILTLVARDNSVVHLGLTGLRDMATEEPMTIDTIFRIYSMTKPITSVALLQLHEEGSLELTDPVTKYLPEFEKVRVWSGGKKLVSPDRPMTVHDLLCHTAGLSYGGHKDSQHPVDKLYDDADLFNLQLTLDESMRRLSGLPLISHPGQAWHYSIATDVVGRLIEVVAGQSLGTFFHQRIFEPLGMVDTGFSVPPEKMERLATLYGRSRATATGLKPLDESIGGDYRNPRLHLGGQGLVSTISDYLQFTLMMLNKGEWQGTRLLDRKTVELMTRNHLSPDHLPISYNGIVDAPVPGIGFGLGFYVLLDPTQAGISGNQGDYGWGGFAETSFWIDPEERIVAILMAQFMPSLTYPIRNEFRTLVYQALEG